jgi:hypothetical protein
MPEASSAYFREQAARCRRLAGDIVDDRAQRELLDLAKEYEARAAELERKPE